MLVFLYVCLLLNIFLILLPLFKLMHTKTWTKTRKVKVAEGYRRMHEKKGKKLSLVE